MTHPHAYPAPYPAPPPLPLPLGIPPLPAPPSRTMAYAAGWGSGAGSASAPPAQPGLVQQQAFPPYPPPQPQTLAQNHAHVQNQAQNQAQTHTTHHQHQYQQQASSSDWKTYMLSLGTRLDGLGLGVGLDVGKPLPAIPADQQNPNQNSYWSTAPSQSSNQSQMMKMNQNHALGQSSNHGQNGNHGHERRVSMPAYTHPPGTPALGLGLGHGLRQTQGPGPAHYPPHHAYAAAAALAFPPVPPPPVPPRPQPQLKQSRLVVGKGATSSSPDSRTSPSPSPASASGKGGFGGKGRDSGNTSASASGRASGNGSGSGSMKATSAPSAPNGPKSKAAANAKSSSSSLTASNKQSPARQRQPKRTPASTPVIDLTADSDDSYVPSSDDEPPRARLTRITPSGPLRAVSTPPRKPSGTPTASTNANTNAKATTPNAKKSTPSPSPGPVASSTVQCAGFTRAGAPCKRTVKASAPLLSHTGANADSDDDDDDEADTGLAGRYCKDHAGLVCATAGFYWRDARGKAGVWIQFDDYIPRDLGQQTQTLLRMTMESALTAKELPGFLYAYELRSLSTARTSYYKVGRTDNVPRRIGQWSNQCTSHTPTLRDIFPLRPPPTAGLQRKPSAPGSLLPGAVKGGVNSARMVPAVKRWERLVHLELADRAAALRAAEYSDLAQPCADCGTIHKEIFPLADGAGLAAYENVVVDAVGRWEAFIRAICD